MENVWLTNPSRLTLAAATQSRRVSFHAHFVRADRHHEKWEGSLFLTKRHSFHLTPFRHYKANHPSIEVPFGSCHDGQNESGGNRSISWSSCLSSPDRFSQQRWRKRPNQFKALNFYPTCRLSLPTEGVSKS
jgi:hypothetical protein